MCQNLAKQQSERLRLINNIEIIADDAKKKFAMRFISLPSLADIEGFVINHRSN